MAAIAITFTREVLPSEGLFLWTAATTLAGESLIATAKDKGEARDLLVSLIVLARRDDLTGEDYEL